MGRAMVDSVTRAMLGERPRVADVLLAMRPVNGPGSSHRHLIRVPYNSTPKKMEGVRELTNRGSRVRSSPHRTRARGRRLGERDIRLPAELGAPRAVFADDRPC